MVQLHSDYALSHLFQTAIRELSDRNSYFDWWLYVIEVQGEHISIQ